MARPESDLPDTPRLKGMDELRFYKNTRLARNAMEASALDACISMLEKDGQHERAGILRDLRARIEQDG